MHPLPHSAHRNTTARLGLHHAWCPRVLSSPTRAARARPTCGTGIASNTPHLSPRHPQSSHHHHDHCRPPSTPAKRGARLPDHTGSAATAPHTIPGVRPGTAVGPPLQRGTTYSRAARTHAHHGHCAEPGQARGGRERAAGGCHVGGHVQAMAGQAAVLEENAL